MTILKLIWSHALIATLAIGITYEATKAFWNEHEQHVLAEQSLKSAQTTITGLQSNIAAVNAQAASDRARFERALASEDAAAGYRRNSSSAVANRPAA